MSHQVTFQFDEHLIRRAVLWRLRRHYGIIYVVALLIAAAYLIAAVISGDQSWLVGVVGTILALGTVFPIASYAVASRRAVRRIREMAVPEATFTASEQTYSISSGGGSSTLPWSTLTEVWQHPDFWMMFLSKSQYFVIPLAGFTPEVREFVLQRVRDAGAKVR
jgi:drug/metabolite transporter (DMT)-like permease